MRRRDVLASLDALAAYAVVLIIVLAPLGVAGASEWQMARGGAVLALLFVVGASAWLLATRDRVHPQMSSMDAAEALGISLTCGLLVVTIGQAGLRAVGGGTGGGVAIAAVFVLIVLLRPSMWGAISVGLRRGAISAAAVALIAVGASLAMAGFPLAWVTAVTGVVVALFEHRADRSRFAPMLQRALIAVGAGGYLLTLAHAGRTGASYPLLGSSESMPDVAWGNSLFRFGPGDNALLAETPLRHHWMSTLVQANLRWLMGTDPEMLVLSGAWAVIATAVTGWLIYSLACRCGLARGLAMLAVALTYVAATVNGPWIFSAESDLTTTVFMGPLVFLALVAIAAGRQIGALLIVIALVPVAVLTNGPAGLLLTGAVVVSVASTSPYPRALAGHFSRLIWLVLPLAMAGGTYLAVMSPTPDATTMIELSITALRSPQSASLMLALPLVRLAQPWLLSRSISAVASRMVGLSAAGSIVSYFVLRNSSGLITDYFALPGIMLFGVAGVAALMSSPRTLSWQSSAERIVSAIVAVGGFVVGLVSILAFNAIQHAGSRLSRWQGVVSWTHVLAPLVAIGLVAAVLEVSRLRRAPSTPRSRSYRRMLRLSLVTLAVGCGLGNSLRGHARDWIDRRHGVAVAPDETVVLNEELLSTLKQFRNASHRDDIVATNYLLGDLVDDFFLGGANVEPERSLSGAIGAVTERRVLVDGDAWAHVGRIYPPNDVSREETVAPGLTVTSRVPAPRWLKARIAASLRFGQSADPAAERYLRQMGVTWFVLDRRDTLLTLADWESRDGITVAFVASETVILDLR